MEREILFRGFCPNEQGKQVITVNIKDIRGDWVYGDVQHNICTTKIREQEKDIERIAKSYSILTDTVCQYTGLKDKNGKQIFEGDIMELDGWASDHSYEYPNEGNECTVQAAIIFNEGKFQPALTADYDDLELMEDAFELYKGKIYGTVIGDKFSTRSVAEVL